MTRNRRGKKAETLGDALDRLSRSSDRLVKFVHLNAPDCIVQRELSILLGRVSVLFNHFTDPERKVVPLPRKKAAR